jgi:hypothetical protein
VLAAPYDGWSAIMAGQAPMDYFFWDEILGRPSLMDGIWEDAEPEEVLQLPEGVVSVIITVFEGHRPQTD